MERRKSSIDKYVTMETVTDRRFIERKDEGEVKVLDKAVRNKWAWKWMEKVVSGTNLAECIRKLPTAGMWCRYNVNYGSRGWKSSVIPTTVPLLPMVPVRDRTVNQEAMLLGFLAEKALLFTLTQPIIDLSKELVRDPKALNALSMDRNTASYEMRFGLAG